jgi:putative hydrolase of the HAD superfamily
LEGNLALRAVIFDYGMVLTGPPDQKAHQELVRITGLPEDRFERLYWADRHAYDEGKLTGIAFWQKFLRDSGLDGGQAMVEELNRWDARMWTTQDPEMVAWQGRLRKNGIRTAILSNMGDSVLDNIRREFHWIDDFDVLVWSFELGFAKPDPRIYRHALQKLGTDAEQALFLDDKKVNVDAALELGMQALEFTTVARLRQDLKARGLEAELPLP